MNIIRGRSSDHPGVYPDLRRSIVMFDGDGRVAFYASAATISEVLNDGDTWTVTITPDDPNETVIVRCM